VCTVVAFGSSVRVWIHVKRIIGAGLHTGLASDAAVVVKIHNPVSTLVQSSCGTNLYAGSIGTVIASVDRKFSCGIRECSFFNIFYMGPVHTNGHIVFAFASDRAGMASDTGSVVNYKSVVQFNLSPH
jgi:hypothetical protein